jgi:isoleucyl-tRNA synthetase
VSQGSDRAFRELVERHVDLVYSTALRKLSGNVQLAQEIIQAALHARERAKLGLRWPVQEVLVETRSEEMKKAVVDLQAVLQKQLNAKLVKVVENVPGVKVTVKPDYGKIGPVYGDLSPVIVTRLKVDSPETVLSHLEKENCYVFRLDGREVKIQREMVQIERVIPPPLFGSEIRKGVVYVNAERTEELEGEGYVRELMRSIQQLRKDGGLEKSDRINLLLQVSPQLKPAVNRWKLEIEQKVGAGRMEIILHEPGWQSGFRPYPQEKEVLIRKEKVVIMMERG